MLIKHIQEASKTNTRALNKKKSITCGSI